MLFNVVNEKGLADYNSAPSPRSSSANTSLAAAMRPAAMFDSEVVGASADAAED